MDIFIQRYKYARHLRYIQYNNFDLLKEIGSGSYGAVYIRQLERERRGYNRNCYTQTFELL